MDVVVDFSDRFGEIGDQGRRLTCLVFASTAAHEYCQNSDQPLCLEWLYFHAIKIGGSMLGDGTRVEDISVALQHHGQPYERVWPYDKATKFLNWMPPFYPGHRYFAEGAYNDFDLKHILTTLDRRVPIVISFWNDREFEDPKTVGEYSLIEQRREKSSSSLHAVLAVGYGYKNQTLYVKVRNSWSRNWGVEGYGWVSEHFLELSGVKTFQLCAVN